MNIVFVSCTPLAGAPIRILNALNTYTDFNVRLINLNPTLYGNRTFPEDLIWIKDREECLEHISRADILHFHHFFDIESENNPFGVNFKKIAPKAKIVRHFHTNLPQLCKWLNCTQNDILNDPYPKLVIPHCTERTFLNAFVVPNIIPIYDDLLMPIQVKNTVPQIFFSATSDISMWDSRWEAKGLPEITEKFKALQNIEKFNFQIIKNTPYLECMQIKQGSDIVIGDITSGSYHLTDLEALSQGKPTLSYLDGRSQMVLQSLLKCDYLPFINTRLEECDLPFIELIRNNELREEIGAISRKWIEEYYTEQKLVEFYKLAYNKILNDEPLSRQKELEYNKAKTFLYNDLYDMQWEARKQKDKTYNRTLKLQKLKENINKIFSVKNEYKDGIKRKIIRILGFKISIKQSQCNNLIHLKEESDVLTILFHIGGGFGDFLINANYIYYLALYIEKLSNKKIKIDLAATNQQMEYLKSVFKNDTYIDNCYCLDEINPSEYDFWGYINCQLIIKKFNKSKIKRLNIKLYDLLEKYIKFDKEHYFEAFYLSNIYHYAMANNKKRIQIADLSGDLQIETNLNFPLPYPNNEHEILDKFNLKNKIFISINRGIDKNNKNNESTKMWQYDKYCLLTQIIKKNYPNIILVQLGASKDRCREIENIDINLCGETNLEEIKVIIKNSILHIDCEGGFAHLRNALKAKHPAIVIFGPTNPELYGYDTNINIRNKNACPIHCDWIVKSWQNKCLRNKKNAPCTNTISVVDVYKHIDEYLKNNL